MPRRLTSGCARSTKLAELRRPALDRANALELGLRVELRVELRVVRETDELRVVRGAHEAHVGMSRAGMSCALTEGARESATSARPAT